MPDRTSRRRVSVGGGRPLADRYRRFAEEVGKASPLYARIAAALSESDAARRAIEAAPARKRHPRIILAALHHLALSGTAPALAHAFAAGDGGASAETAIDTLVRRLDSVVDIVEHRQIRTHVSGHHAVLYPAIAEAARRLGAKQVGLVDVGGWAGLNLNVDRAGITYSSGQFLGDPSAPVQVSAAVRGGRRLPETRIPEVVTRVGVDRDPLDVTDADEARWLLACLPPDQPEPAARLEAELALAATAPPVWLVGDPVERLPDALAHVPADALSVVITTWALSALPLESRTRFLDCLEDAARSRTVAWVSAEGVGVAPAIPTLGDRPASGHSIVGLATLDQANRDTAAIGRCWSRGRLLQWLADS